MSAVNILLSLCFSLAIAFGQVLFKLSALQLATRSGGIVERIMLSPLLWLTFLWYGLSSALWVYILMRVPLSLAYPFTLLGAAIVPIVAMMVFKEPLSTRYWIGGAFILFGMYLALAAPGGSPPSLSAAG